MKKLLVAAAALAALVLASCSNPVAKANDQLDAPDVTAVATENGVVVLSWEKVKDAVSYEVFVKNPGTEAYDSVDTISADYGNTVVRVVPVYELDKEYSFKVCAKHAVQNSYNLLDSSFSEVSVTTPEEWKDTAVDASKITINLVKNTLNKYAVSVPVDAGFKYTVKAVNATGNAKVIFNNSNKIATVNVASDVMGATKVAKTITVTNAEGDEEDAIAPAYMGDATISIDNATSYDAGKNVYYVVVKAEPLNSQVATTKYVVSTASAAFNPAAINVKTNDDVAVTQTGAEKARLTFTAPKIQGVDVDASKFVVYRSETSKIRTTLQDTSEVVTTTSYAPVAGLKKDATLSNSKSTVYVLDDTIKAYDQVKAYLYNYVVVAENDYGAVWSNTATLTVNGNDAWVRTLNTPFVSVTQKADNKVKLSVYGVTRGATLTVKYAAFDSESAAAKAVNGDLTATIPVTMDAGQTAPTTGTIKTETTNKPGSITGTVSNTMWNTVTYSLDDYAIDPAVIVTETTSVVDGVTVINSDRNENGKYYVVKAFVTMEGCDPVESSAVTVKIQKNVSTVSGATTTTWTNFSAN